VNKHPFDYRKILIKLPKSDSANKFLEALRKNSIPVYQLVIQKQHIQFEVRYKDLKKIKAIRRKYRLRLQLKLIDKNKILQVNLKTLLGLIILITIPIICQSYIWGVHIEAETIERKVEVREFLKELNVDFPVKKNQIMQESQLRQEMLLTLPNVSWVHIEKASSKLKLSIQEAPRIKQHESTTGSYLVAKQSGVITHYFIESGVKNFQVNQSVEKGELLVTGVVNEEDTEHIVPVKGQVFADFWKTIKFSLPKKISVYELTDSYWNIQFGKNNQNAIDEFSLPKLISRYVQIDKVPSYEKRTLDLNEKTIDTLLLPLLHQKTISSLSSEAVIKSEKLLHVTFDNDTVKGEVLYLVNDNIAITSPINQGE